MEKMFNVVYCVADLMKVALHTLLKYSSPVLHIQRTPMPLCFSFFDVERGFTIHACFIFLLTQAFVAFLNNQ